MASKTKPMAFSDLTLDQYGEYVEGAFATAPSAAEAVIFTNRGPDRAKIVHRSLINSAERTLSIFCGSLSADVFDAELLRAAIERASLEPVRILLDGNSPSSNSKSALDELTDLVNNGRVVVKNINRKSQSATNNSSAIHFSVADSINVRVETNVKARSATIVLNDASIGQAFQKLFNEFWIIAD